MYFCRLHTIYDLLARPLQCEILYTLHTLTILHTRMKYICARFMLCVQSCSFLLSSVVPFGLNVCAVRLPPPPLTLPVPLQKMWHKRARKWWCDNFYAINQFVCALWSTWNCNAKSISTWIYESSSHCVFGFSHWLCLCIWFVGFSHATEMCRRILIVACHFFFFYFPCYIRRCR